MFSIVDHQRQAAMVSDYIASKRVTREQYLKTNHSLRLGIAGPPGKYGLLLYVRFVLVRAFYCFVREGLHFLSFNSETGCISGGIESNKNWKKLKNEMKILFFTGAGKSTFIENLGMKLIKKNNRVAVIPVDPSSHISGGSILGE